MKTSFQTRQITWAGRFLALAFYVAMIYYFDVGFASNSASALFECRADESGIASEKWQTEFDKKYLTYINAPTNMTVSEVHSLLANNFEGAPLLNMLLQDPICELKPDVLDIDYPLFGRLFNFNSDISLPQPTLAEFMRRIVGLQVLEEKDPNSLCDLVWERKDSLPVTIWDGYLADIQWDKLPLFLKTESQKNKWSKLFQAKNPLFRMVALKFSDKWGSGVQLERVWKEALNDEYFYQHKTALEFFIQRRPPSTKEVLQEFLKRKIDPNLSESCKFKELELNKEAQQCLDELQNQKSPTGSPKRSP